MNKYPIIIIPTVVIPKNMAKSCQRIIFLSINASGSEMVTVAVIKAKTVPNGAPLLTNASIIGITLTEPAYIGTPIITARGTVHHALADK